jgi:hypothetical protein
LGGFDKSINGEIEMPSKSSGQPRKYSETEYIRCELDKQLKKDLEAWLKQKHDFWAFIDKEVQNGLRFACHVDAFNKCVEARLTALSNSADINTLVLQGRGPSLDAAIQALFFKHYVVLEGDWSHLDRDNAGKFSDWG